MSAPNNNDIGLGSVTIARPVAPALVRVLEAEAHPSNKSIWRKTWALQVPGGWIVYCQAMPYSGDSALCSTYVPDPEHTWFTSADDGSSTTNGWEAAP